MARKRYSDADVLNLLSQIKLGLASGSSVATACRLAGVSDGTYYNWRKKYGGMGKSQLQELKGLDKENSRLKRIVADLELATLILKESLDYPTTSARGERIMDRNSGLSDKGRSDAITVRLALLPPCQMSALGQEETF